MIEGRDSNLAKRLLRPSDTKYCPREQTPGRSRDRNCGGGGENSRQTGDQSIDVGIGGALDG
jgi:hypothetical protein